MLTTKLSIILVNPGHQINMGSAGSTMLHRKSSLPWLAINYSILVQFHVEKIIFTHLM